MKTILFDLDGTLIDSREGIIESMKYAFVNIGAKVPARQVIEKSIGPPLGEMIRKLLNKDDEALINKAIEYYRAHYDTKGFLKVRLYDGINTLLTKLYGKAGLFIVTNKPQHITLDILKHLMIINYFLDVKGQIPSEKKNKKEMIFSLMRDYALDNKECIFVGDTKEDIFAAKMNEMKSIAVYYGYGSKASIDEAEPEYKVKDPEELVFILTRLLKR